MRTDDFDYDLPDRAHRPGARRAARLVPAAGARPRERADRPPRLLRPPRVPATRVTCSSSTTRACCRRDSTASRTRPAAPSRCCCCASATRTRGSVSSSPAGACKPGAQIVFGDGAMTGLVVDVDRRERRAPHPVHARARGRRFLDVVHRIGEMPLPPYITRAARRPRAVSDGLLARGALRRGADGGPALHAGAARARARRRASHVETRRARRRASTRSGRSAEDDPCAAPHPHGALPRPAAGPPRSSTRRTSAAAASSRSGPRACARSRARATTSTGGWWPHEGATSLYILPGYRFDVVDAMVTNFHVPRSTLLMMVSAFAGRELGACTPTQLAMRSATGSCPSATRCSSCRLPRADGGLCRHPPRPVGVAGRRVGRGGVPGAIANPPGRLGACRRVDRDAGIVLSGRGERRGAVRRRSASRSAAGSAGHSPNASDARVPRTARIGLPCRACADALERQRTPSRRVTSA